MVQMRHGRSRKKKQFGLVRLAKPKRRYAAHGEDAPEWQPCPGFEDKITTKNITHPDKGGALRCFLNFEIMKA